MIIETELKIGEFIGFSRINGKSFVNIDVIEISDISEINYNTVYMTDTEKDLFFYIKNIYANINNNIVSIETAKQLLKIEYDKYI